jgi:DNA-binding response OmpR family regulator
MRLLIVEDDKSTSFLLRRLLIEDGYEVDVAATDAEARAQCAANQYDGLILDLQLGDRHGLEILTELRQYGMTTPVLVYTGSSDLVSITRLLDAGADGYVVKPVPNAELCARVRALVRRGEVARNREQLTVGDLQLNRLTRRVRFGSTELNLTATEIRLLEHLMLHVSETVSRSDLREKVWDMHFDPGSNIVDAHVARLRKKLDRVGAGSAIRTRRGVGFVLSAPTVAVQSA